MEVKELPMKEGVHARTLVIPVKGGDKYEVMTFDLRTIRVENETSQKVVKTMIGKYPFETTVYRLCHELKPLVPIEELLSEELGTFENMRRDLSVGDMYLSRSRNQYEAASEHQNVVDGILSGSLRLMSVYDRVAILGLSNVVG